MGNWWVENWDQPCRMCWNRESSDGGCVKLKEPQQVRTELMKRLIKTCDADTWRKMTTWAQK